MIFRIGYNYRVTVYQQDIIKYRVYAQYVIMIQQTDIDRR